ncbi:unnamed protein product [Rotaria magnacalcarata]|uniref:L-serine deaminase n=1 Tax=Rotaria magnacalcarata TaxID=392030 RepID=A0A814FKF0_9BILA|nr:unnamed protein product [Rotaria magnacalcarata]CAF1225437.1 unnamed protein product [Rotaria magnacalcarata]CAF1916022.1 unnamed protein product [Rotaria magnacalcarata]CAF1934719.1 unnamed protein product [Rotaria magnacalcarata]CAF1947689.1 unnamed protein product [Rotaria magnacalcarata]
MLEIQPDIDHNGRMTMLDERYLSVADLQERQQKLDHEIKSLDLGTLEITEDDLYDECCDPKTPRILRFEEIAAAAYRIKFGVERTPCTSSHLSKVTGMDLYLKKEFLLHTGSFKERGARNTLMTLPPEEKGRGVIAASAGNHALAVCYHGQQLGIPVVVVMPRHAPIMKVNNCRSFGAVVIVRGMDLSESKRVALKLSKMFQLRYVNGFDHPNILAGQGSLGLEVLDQVPDVDAIVVPTGGGGLLAGIAVAVKSVNPRVQVIAVESERAPGFLTSWKAGRPVFTECLSTLADGLAVSLVGANAFATAAPLVDKVVSVSEEYIAIAILRLVEMEKAVVEGAGAAGLAAILQGLLPELKGKKVVIPLCGGNIDTTVLGRVLERGLVADKRLVKVWLTVSDRPGSLAQMCKLFSTAGASVKDIYHERAWLKSDMFSVQIQVVLEVRDSEHADEVTKIISENYEDVKFYQGQI